MPPETIYQKKKNPQDRGTAASDHLKGHPVVPGSHILPTSPPPLLTPHPLLPRAVLGPKIKDDRDTKTASDLWVSFPQAPKNKQRRPTKLLRVEEGWRKRTTRQAVPHPHPRPRPGYILPPEPRNPSHLKRKRCLFPLTHRPNAPFQSFAKHPTQRARRPRPRRPVRRGCVSPHGLSSHVFASTPSRLRQPQGSALRSPAPGYKRNALDSLPTLQLVLNPPHSSKAAIAATAAGATGTKRRRRHRHFVGPRLRQENWRVLPLPLSVYWLSPPQVRLSLAKEIHLLWGPVAKAVYVIDSLHPFGEIPVQSH